ncbi:hypothetical protein PUNSTDRAFT_72884 [Punctularia strigosozonata HHB-11173 SS5]|uniref:uncharacterized protein n=1 Tax=Punctularia strigosozonata (strain HHB-11173) TaxID=741275 RepID=UPI000441639B|nr:uncharacterized protein PUNSTDRAFT_72884 [Punctularia strigosozonata HHB-11173 SS5]EIN06715.1 hypothetical protein PUNSTDRAFT_72884 [Punctularia strigosozonata HHB-11173 SS5]
MAGEEVHFSLVMFSADSGTEGAMLIKSILMYTTRPTAFHIVCDEGAQSVLESRISLVRRPRYDIRVVFYRVAREAMEARIRREGGIYTEHYSGIYGLMKLFIHEILPPTVKRSIFVDTDAIFISDPTLLWRRFDAFDPWESADKPGTALSMPTHMDQSTPDWHDASKICSCVMLMDLEKLRKLRLMDSEHYRSDSHNDGRGALSPPAFVSMFGPPSPETGHYENVKLGDQGYYWAIVAGRPDIFKHLPIEWEVSSCLQDMYGTGAELGDDAVSEEDETQRMINTANTAHANEAILPKFLHFNCLWGTEHWYEWEGWADPSNSLTRRWLSTVKHHVAYKWIWLNIHPAGRELGADGVEPGKVTMNTVSDAKFADEAVFAGASK